MSTFSATPTWPAKAISATGDQAAVAAVVVGEDQAARAQGIDGGHQALEVFGVIQIRHLGAARAQHLAQDGAAQTHLSVAQVDEHDGAVFDAGVELRRERAAHIRQRGKGADDEADGRDHLPGGALRVPRHAHR